ncbi:uncharacterized protein ATNIH1004_001839 [Aspergillus tanneri]|uniref:Cytochrome P450-dit2 n=1 Tax=Aspergillus tanneri TaxID=1220188 RepID=A0A5M9N5D6_9EURO|nr:uncharacterized protein ATNIH1004_001839 [Aspergillus tanneri]KAA8652930.1 hypothetical protein ATNIH1004_001839 [Aspergillus tanneri]
MPPGLIDMFELFNSPRGVSQDYEGEGMQSSKEKHSEPRRQRIGLQISPRQPEFTTSEKTFLRLEQESALLTPAGTESPAQTLNIIFYHLLANPFILSKLRAELELVSTSLSWTKLEKLPYLSAIIEERNKLSFGVTARAACIQHKPIIYTPTCYVTSPSSMRKSYILPAGTPISIITNAESVFPDPYDFDPDRWLGDEGRKRRKGGRKCGWSSPAQSCIL